MATRSGTLPYGSETREPGESPAPPPSELPSPPAPQPPTRGSFWRTPRQPQGPLSGTAIAVVAAAAIWVGLALFMGAWVYRMAPGSRVVLMIIGGWLLASGTAYVIAGRPSQSGPTSRMA